MKKKKGIHFYINIENFNRIIKDEEEKTGKLNHAIHALDVFFSSIENFGKSHFSDEFTIEKITGSRLHMYVETDIQNAFAIVSTISLYAQYLSEYMSNQIAKYQSLIKFQIQVGACFGHFYNFTFKGINVNEDTSIGYAANFAAKLQTYAKNGNIAISENIYTQLFKKENKSFIKRVNEKITSYGETCYYETAISNLETIINFSKDLQLVSELANKVNLKDIEISDAYKLINYNNLSKTNVKRIFGIPLFADVRGFTKQFDKDDANLDEMSKRTQEILESMYTIVVNNNGVHVQFQGDREEALFHNYSDYDCCTDAVITALRIIDKIKEYGVSIGIGQSIGGLFATRIGTRNEKDNILIGETVLMADNFEDAKAKDNQIVISKEIYENLKKHETKLYQIFKRENNYYITNCGYKEYVNQIRYKYHDSNNKNNNYNGAWGE